MCLVIAWPDDFSKEQFVELTRLECFFFLIILQPRRSTLFPYTTLFRSQGAARAAVAARGSRLASRRSARSSAEPADAPDRKSTRLNSSHITISYAVFCLKKKKTTATVIRLHPSFHLWFHILYPEAMQLT